MRIGTSTFMVVLLGGVFPQGSIGQTCSPMVDVPAFMTIKVGETKAWNVEFGNDGPDTAEVLWTLTPGGCDKKLKAEPKTGKAVLPDGGRKTDTVSVTAESDVCARNDADFPVVAKACGDRANDSGKICILPTGETTEPAGEALGGDIALFRVKLEPETANFWGRTVYESQGNTWDECAGGNIPPFTLQGVSGGLSSWTIESRNYFSSEDQIGYSGNFDPSEYILNRGQAPCTSGCVQKMWINCDNATAYYTEHNVSIHVDADGEAWITRDGITQGPI